MQSAPDSNEKKPAVERSNNQPMEGIIANRRQREMYNRLMLQLWHSKAYLDFCEDLYGYRRCLFNSLYHEQYQHLFHELAITSDDSVLDLGCGCGAVINSLVQTYSCKGIGIDYAPDLITALISHYPNIAFHNVEIENMRNAPVDADVIISLDSLYACGNLTAVFAGLKSRCRKYIYVYYTQEINDPNGDISTLQPDNTGVAVALRPNNLDYSVIDFSSDEWNLWKKEKTILDKHRSAFEEEGNLSVWNGRLEDTDRMLRLFGDNRARRFLYKIVV